MPLLTPELLHKVREVVAKHHAAFIARAFGPEALPKETVDVLRAAKLLPAEPAKAVENAYLYGHVAARLDDPSAESWSKERLQRWLKDNPVPLTAPEQAAVAAANATAGMYVQGLGGEVAKETGQLVIDADRKLRELQAIREGTAANISARETVRQLKSDLGWASRDWTRNLDRVAVTEKHNAMQLGALDYIRKKHGEGARVAVLCSANCCAKCAELYRGPDGQPRIFKIGQLAGPGANVGRKQADWLPCCGSTHPHCGCRVVHVPEGWGFNEEGEMRPGARGGVFYEGPSGPEGMLEAFRHETQHQEELRKARKLAGRLRFRGLRISVETDKGGERHWHDHWSGEDGTTVMKYPYGYIRGTLGTDGDHVDVYVGPNPEAEHVYVVHQRKKLGPGKFGGYDEDKAMLGFSSPQEAKAAYLAHYNDEGFFGSMSEMPFAEFKERVKDADHKGEALLGGTAGLPEATPGIILVVPISKAVRPEDDVEACKRAILDEVEKEPGVPFHKLTDRVSASFGEDLGGVVARMLVKEGKLQVDGDPQDLSHAGYYPENWVMEKAGGPYIGPRGGKWADPQHTVHWDPDSHRGSAPRATIPAPTRPAPVVPDTTKPAASYPSRTPEDHARRAHGLQVLQTSKEHIPLSRVGIHPASPDEHRYAATIREDKDFWAKVPETHVSGGSNIAGTERDVKSKHVGPVVRGEVPLREGYAPLMLQRKDGSFVTVDGHHRMAMHRMMGSHSFAAKVAPMPEHVDHSVQPVTPHDGSVAPKVLDGLAAAIGAGKLKGSPQAHVETAKKELEKHAASIGKLKDELRSISPPGADVKARVKELESTVGKLVRKPKYGDATSMQDLTGARVILGNVDEVRNVVSELKKRYKVVTEDDYISKPQGDYRSHHLIIEHDGLQKEIQVRTERQNTFAMWSHHVYKPENPAQEHAMKAHADEVGAYSNAAAGYLWLRDSGQPTDPPPPPPCSPAVASSFGCLEFR